MLKLFDSKTRLDGAIRRGAALALAAVAIGAYAVPAHAALVTNGTFTTSATDSYVLGSVTGWTVANTGTTTTPLTCLDVAGKADICGTTFMLGSSYLQLAANPGAPPGGGNAVVSDANPSFVQTISQTLTGLTVGTTYAVSFEQAAGNVLGEGVPVAIDWAVSVGGTLAGTSASETAPVGSVGPWELETVTFTATSASEALSFLAQGTPVGGPPIALLGDVSVAVAPIPEPASLALFGLGVVGLIGLARTRTGNSAAI